MAPKGNVESANPSFLSSSLVLSDPHFTWKDKENQKASWGWPRWGAGNARVKTHRMFKKAILKYIRDSIIERASPSPHRPNNSPNPHPSQGLCKRNLAAKTAPSTPGRSRGKVGLINDALTLSYMPLSVPGNSSNNHPRIVKSRYSIIGANALSWAAVGYVSGLTELTGERWVGGKNKHANTWYIIRH